jgi:hypothetical protein
MRPILPKLREALASNPRMKYCNHADENCEGKIEWHHVWIYGGKQINEEWAIVAACAYHHRMVGSNKKIREHFERISLILSFLEDLEKYPRKNWSQIKKYLKI